MPLTDAQIKTLKPASKPKKISDGGGLHLLVSPQGSKLWRLAYRCEKKQKTLALGVYPTVSLAEAREKRDAAKKLLASGIDPSEQQKADKAARLALTENTFEAVADDFLAKTKREGKAEATLSKKRWLLEVARADLGHRPITEISAAEVLVRSEKSRNRETTKQRGACARSSGRSFDTG